MEDLDGRMQALMIKETQKVQQEVKTAKSQMETVLQQFENQLRTASPDQFNSLVRKSESAVASIVQTHCSDDFTVSEVDINMYSPQVGEQVFLKRLRNKLATVVEAPTDDETLLVQYGKIKVRVNKSDIMASSDCNKSSATSSVQSLKRQVCSKMVNDRFDLYVLFSSFIRKSFFLRFDCIAIILINVG